MAQFPITQVIWIPKHPIFGFWMRVFDYLINILYVCSAVCSDENRASANSSKLHDFYDSDDCHHQESKVHHQNFHIKQLCSKNDKEQLHCELGKMVKLATLNLAKFCQIFEIIALHGGFDGGHQVQNACHHQSSKNHATLMNLLMLDFRHYIPTLHTYKMSISR